MNNIEQNALRIAELTGTFMYNKFARMGQLMSEKRGEKVKCIEYYSSYQGLMPIVFECEMSEDHSITITSSSVHISELHTSKPMSKRNSSYAIKNTKESFIEAIQLACIKYLELKNGNKHEEFKDA